ncbi:hypothetical protein IAG44_13315 [Streptomyces roseirectus]|uniref:Uncharacterized protein n=1 Tax=Streptomyces roseirectus TaxID=2768066 RepID=A0A7H0ITV8_9ACTN|nr:hypothetical protein [Streptomyces roseirectus]QNP76224.1 hypothetical protein IAG44_13315 [Streptomyces roseirectus]
MGALAWLGIPLLAAIGAGVWGSWANRTRRTRGDGPELDGYAKFRAAMERPLPHEPAPPMPDTPLLNVDFTAPKPPAHT